MDDRRDSLLRLLWGRIEDFRERRDTEVVLSQAALDDVAALLNTVTAGSVDLDVQLVAGTLHFVRARLLKAEAGERDAIAAAGLFWPVYRVDPSAIPGEIRSALDSLAPEDGGGSEKHEALADGTLCQALLTKDKMALDRAITELARLLHTRSVETFPPSLEERLFAKLLLALTKREDVQLPIPLDVLAAEASDLLVVEVGNAWRSRFNRTNLVGDLSQCIDAYEEAARRIPADDPNHALLLGNLGGAYTTRFDHTAIGEDI